MGFCFREPKDNVYKPGQNRILEAGVLTGKVRRASSVVISRLCSIVRVLAYRLLRSALGLSTAGPMQLQSVSGRGSGGTLGQGYRTLSATAQNRHTC